MKSIIYILTCIFCSFGALAQETASTDISQNKKVAMAQPFLYSVNTLTPDDAKWTLQYSGSYAERASGQFGYNGTVQQFGAKGYLGNSLTLYASAAIGFSGNRTNSAQQVEVIKDLIGRDALSGLRIGAGLGVSRDWTNVKSALSRVTISYDRQKWQLIGNMRFEKAFDSTRDKLDFISSIGFQHQITVGLFLGVEAIGQDLEGFWDKNEAEGGAKMLIGPSLSLYPKNGKLSFSLAGGPVFYATKSQVVSSAAIRELTPLNSGNGYSLRALVNFSL